VVEIRMKRGQEILQKGATITKVDNTTYTINSLTSNSVYEINNLGLSQSGSEKKKLSTYPYYLRIILRFLSK